MKIWQAACGSLPQFTLQDHLLHYYIIISPVHSKSTTHWEIFCQNYTPAASRLEKQKLCSELQENKSTNKISTCAVLPSRFYWRGCGLVRTPFVCLGTPHPGHGPGGTELAPQHHLVPRGDFSLVSVRPVERYYFTKVIFLLEVTVSPSAQPSMWCVNLHVYYFPITIPGQISLSDCFWGMGEVPRMEHYNL